MCRLSKCKCSHWLKWWFECVWLCNQMLSVKPSGVGEEVLSILKCVGDFFFFFVRACVCSVTDPKRQLVASTAINPRHSSTNPKSWQRPRQKRKEEKTSRIIRDRRNIFQRTGCDWIIPLGFKPKGFRTVNFGTSIKSLLYTWPFSFTSVYTAS